MTSSKYPIGRRISDDGVCPKCGKKVAISLGISYFEMPKWPDELEPSDFVFSSE